MSGAIKLVAFLVAIAGGPSWALQVGSNDFRITQAGPGLDEDYRAVNPSVAYNATANEFLVVWSGDAPADAPVLEDEIYAQRLDGDSGQNIGQPVRVSRMGPDVQALPEARRNSRGKGEGTEPPFFEALDPRVAWNSQDNSYLVVWWGDDDTPPLVDNEREVFGRHLGADGSPLAEQFRISAMGDNGDVLAEAKVPAMAYSASQNEFLVTWTGDNINGVFANQEFEIWGQRVAGNSNTLIGSVLRISDMGAEDGNPSFTAADSAIAVDETRGNYFVTWEGDDDADGAVDGEVEIYGQLIDMASGLEIGTNDFRISALGPDGDTGFDSTNAAPVYNRISGEYLVAWNGSDDENGAVRNDMEIYVKRIGPGGALLGSARRITAMGPDGVDTYWAVNPVVGVDPIDGQYLVLFRAENDDGALVNNEYEVYGQRLDVAGVPTLNRVRLSTMGPDGNSQYDAGLVRMAYNPASGRFLAVWDGNDLRPDLAPREIEVFGQFLLLDVVYNNGFEP